MHVIARKPLIDFGALYPDSKSSLRSWWKVMKHGRYRTPHEVRADFPSASFLGDELTVFNIGGNKYRLVAFMVYRTGLVYVDAVYTHEEYERLVRAGLLGTNY
jgi:mRNA interferase HigB